jgi:hypothetical protein
MNCALQFPTPIWGYLHWPNWPTGVGELSKREFGHQWQYCSQLTVTDLARDRLAEMA